MAKKRRALKKKAASARRTTAGKKKAASARNITAGKKKAASARNITAIKIGQGNEGSRDEAMEFFRRARSARFFPT